MVLERDNNVDVNVHEAQCDSILSAYFDVITFHSKANSLGTSLLQGQNLRVKNRRNPVSRQYEKVKKCLKGMKPLAGRMVDRVVIKEHEWFSSEGIRIFFSMIGI